MFLLLDMAVLFHVILQRPEDLEQRDRFILSKGHASLALYCALESVGLLSKEEVDTFEQNGSHYTAHAKKDIDGMLEYIQIYADSVASNDSSDKRTKNALALLKYLSNNKDALIPWPERGLDIPEPPAGVIYKDMGVQENQNCTLITLRMKHRRMRWGKRGGNNMVKVLYRRENHELHETINRYSNKLKFADIEIIEILSAAQAAKKDGRGSHYLDILNAHMPLIEAKITEGRKAIVGLSM